MDMFIAALPCQTTPRASARLTRGQQPLKTALAPPNVPQPKTILSLF